jgi:hypothetical protein
MVTEIRRAGKNFYLCHLCQALSSFVNSENLRGYAGSG